MQENVVKNYLNSAPILSHAGLYPWILTVVVLEKMISGRYDIQDPMLHNIQKMV